jgi:hypothetical protein
MRCCLIALDCQQSQKETPRGEGVTPLPGLILRHFPHGGGERRRRAQVISPGFTSAIRQHPALKLIRDAQVRWGEAGATSPRPHHEFLEPLPARHSHRQSIAIEHVGAEQSAMGLRT